MRTMAGEQSKGVCVPWVEGKATGPRAFLTDHRSSPTIPMGSHLVSFQHNTTYLNLLVTNQWIEIKNLGIGVVSEQVHLVVRWSLWWGHEK